MQVEITVTLEEKLNGASRSWEFSGSVHDECAKRAEDAARHLMRQFSEEVAASQAATCE